MKDHNKKFIKDWNRENPICIRCGFKVKEGWGHDCLYYECENCRLFFTDEDVMEIRYSKEKVN